MNACPSTWWPGLYLEGGWPAELRDHIGESVRIFGTTGGGSVEGPFVVLDHYDFAPCAGSTPVRPSSWGRLKLLYR